MSNFTDKATVDLFVNGEQPKQEIDRLTKQLEEYKTRLVEADKAGDLKASKSLQKQIEQTEKQLTRMSSAAAGVGVVLDDLSNTNIHGLRNALKYLEKEWKFMKPNTAEWNECAENIKKVKGRINELKESLAEIKEAEPHSLWEQFKEWSVQAWPALDLLRQWGGNFFDIMRGAVDAYADMDQEMANVRKFTGMTAEQVADLNEEFKKMDTRTSREDLNKLAQEAGRLGKTSKEDVLGFIRAADKINVALDDLGEGATLTLSKLTGVFGDEAVYGTEKSLLKVGSVINELSQNCSASAPYLAQFTSRMGGVGAQAKMTIPQIMAFGAVLDSNGQAVEASSTALSQVIVRMMQEPAKYAKVAGLDVKKFSDMLKTDVNGALILFLETLQKAGGMDVLSPMFKDMGENGSRAIASLSTLATHIEDVKAQQIEANKAFAEGISIDNEFNVQNTTVQASIEKAKKAVHDLRVELGEHLAPLMSHIISSSSAMIRALLTLAKFVFDNKTAIISLTAGIAAYTIAANMAAMKTAAFTAASKVMNAVMGTLKYTIGLAEVAMIAFTHGTKAAGTAFTFLNSTLKANPIGLVVGVVTTAITALGSWIYKIHSARKAERELIEQRRKNLEEFKSQVSDVTTLSADYAAKETHRLKTLYDATQDVNKSENERIAAVKELQRTYPTAFSNLTTEAILAGNASEAYNTLAENILKVAKAKAASEKLVENQKQLIELEFEKESLEPSIEDDKKVREAAQKRLQSLKHDISRSHSADKIQSLDLSLGNRQRKDSMAAMKESKRETESVIEAVDDRLKTNTARLEDVNSQISAINDANQKLTEMIKEAPVVDIVNPDPNANGNNGYVSQTLSEKERKKQEAEARRAAAKAKKEFKATLDSYKAQRSAADREALELYQAGSIEYEQLLQRRHENEEQYYENSLSFFEETFKDQKETYLQDDKDYQKLLLDREKADEKYNQTVTALRLNAINRRKTAEERDAQHMYSVKSDPTLNDEIALQAELYRIRRTALDETKALYQEGTKEYADIQYQIESLESDKEIEMKKLYFKAYSSFRSEYDKKNAAERFELEKATLDALLAAKKISTAQYAEFLKGMTEKYREELPGASSKGWSESDQTKYTSDVEALNDALSSQLLSQEQFNERLANLDAERREKMLAGLKDTGGQWNSMLVDIYTSFAHLLDGLDGSLAGTLGNISSCVAAVSSAVSAGMSIATEFAKAEAEIQVKAVEKRYDREIELAQGNSYKVAKLEKKKEQETAKIKNEASKKEYQMKIFDAIAQSIIAGLNAYSSTVQIPIVGPTLAPVAMAVALAMGAAQVALLKKQQAAAAAQGYSKGGFTRPGAVDEPAGIVHAGEWVASQKLLASPVARPMIEALDYVQRTNTIGSLKPEDVSRSIRANDSLVRMAESDGSAAAMAAAMAKSARAVDDLTSRLNEPFVTINTVTGDHGIKRAEDEYTRLMRNKSPRSKRKSNK